jgi:hypothetical protein
MDPVINAVDGKANLVQDAPEDSHDGCSPDACRHQPSCKKLSSEGPATPPN